jgi:enoyl-CoA hydratase/carnithine racemase
MTDLLAGGRLELDRPADAVVRLRLADATRPNPLDHELLDAIAEVLPWLSEGIENRCLSLAGRRPSSGRGAVFSAGYDLSSIGDESFAEDAEALVAHPFAEAMEAISSFPFPVIAAIDGPCLGGGLELAVRCDVRLAGPEAKLGMPPARLGLVYGHTGLERFLEVIGVARTRELFLTARNIDATEAERIGLVNHVVDDVDAAALEMAAEIAANAPLSMRGNKRAIDLLAARPLDPETERELVALREACFASDDLREGITAFAEKREPRWRGR